MSKKDFFDYYYNLRKFRDENSFTLDIFKMARIDRELERLEEYLTKSPFN